ncbi:HD-GYP domain-containing protein [Agathobacter rectalis]|jgi:HD-GYP domain-containing protein (c-di-GMP phosphodiesterase class II)|uniref:HD domain-containing protein n=1 Tax=Agathobacter rectalis TaxID=39491 RepID=A0A3E4YKU1_9FIRM|nr:HD domain-containing phosphohydrolase [Agathobacter rectalis]MCB7108308.1 HD domain-containing protein [Agathobacter rectalis]MCG4811814.1 HD domain-containing protein [Agathobacter rectalis]RGM75379.1 HD domain-containing protein [Agathobacter rectalis]
MEYKELLEKIKKKPEVAVLLGILKASSMDTYNHCSRVAIVTGQILDQLDNSYTDEEKEQILIGALLHDVGKVFLPFNITAAPFSLSYEEMGIVKIHPYVGYEILKDAFPTIVTNIALMHHEKPDGSGYPNGNRLRNIPNYVLIVQVADVFDAICSNRPYKKGKPKDETLNIMDGECRMIRLDDEYVDKLKKIIEKERMSA